MDKMAFGSHNIATYDSYSRHADHLQSSFAVILLVTCSHVSDEKRGISDILLWKPVHFGIST